MPASWAWRICSGGNVLVTAISVIESGLCPDRSAAAAMRSCTRAMFSVKLIRAITTKATKVHEGNPNTCVFLREPVYLAVHGLHHRSWWSGFLRIAGGGDREHDHQDRQQGHY